MTERRFTPPWSVVEIAGGFKVIDSYGRSLPYVYSSDDLAVAISSKNLAPSKGFGLLRSAA